MDSIHSEALAILGPEEAIHKLQSETIELLFAINRFSEGKGDSIAIYRELEDVLFVMLRIDLIWDIQRDVQHFDVLAHRKQSAEKLRKVIQDKLKREKSS